MVTTYNKESHTTTTFKDINAGYGIFADNEIYYADDEAHYVDGAVVFSDITTVATTISDTRHTLMANNSALLARTVFYMANGKFILKDTLPGHGIRCDDEVILCNETKYDCQGAVMFYNEGY